MEGLGLTLDLQFQVPVYLLHLGRPKAGVLGGGLSRLVQTPDGFTSQDYLGTQVFGLCAPLAGDTGPQPLAEWQCGQTGDTGSRQAH